MVAPTFLCCTCIAIACLLVQTEASRRFGPQDYMIASPAVYRRGRRATTYCARREPGLAFFYDPSNADSAADDSNEDIRAVQQCSTKSIGSVLLRGAFLRIASDLSGGTAFEHVKTRVSTTTQGPVQAYQSMTKNGGFFSLWSGTQSRIVEGALVGAVFMLGSTLTKAQVTLMGGSPTVAALAGGLVGGVAQAAIMTPAGMIFTSLNYNKGKPGYENDNAITIVKRIVADKGIRGMYYGGGPMALRQASNWASRASFTEIARSTLGLSKYGVAGEIASGIIGGLGSCWNTPIETVRMITQRDVSSGREPKTMTGYWGDIVETQGYPGLFRGITPRALQAVWQTCFLVVVPNLMGI
jgi:hypothetical protein